MWQFCLASPLPKAYCEELLEACLALAAGRFSADGHQHRGRGRGLFLLRWQGERL